MKKNEMVPEALRELTRHEKAAMWLYSQEYARLGIGAIRFWQELGDYEKSNVRRMVKEISEAPDEDD